MSKLLDKLLRLDINFIFIFIGAILMHGAFVSHFQYTLMQGFVSGLGLGFILGSVIGHRMRQRYLSEKEWEIKYYPNIE